MKMKLGRVVGIIILAALFMEIVICNIFSFLSWTNEEKNIDLAELGHSEGAVLTKDYGLYFPGTQESVVELQYHEGAVQNLSIQVSCINGEEFWTNSIGTKVYAQLYSTMVQVTITGIDENGNETVLTENRRIGARQGMIDVIPLSSDHNYDRIRIQMSGVKGTELVLEKLSVNSKIPFGVVPLRFLFFILLFTVIYAFRKNSRLWQTEFLNNERKMKSGVRRGIIGGIVLLSLWLLFLILQNPVYVKGNGGFEPYIELAHALANHQTWIAQEVPQELMNLSNPYDVYERAYSGVRYLLDYAYYEGHYYVYFGIVPCLVFYLPSYLIFGLDPGNWLIIWFLIIAMMAGIITFLRAIARRYYQDMPVAMMILGFFLLLFLGAPPTVLSDACTYYIPMLMAIDLLFFGLALWIDAVDAKNKDLSYGKIALGAFLIALVAGCRPQLVLTAALVIPFLGIYILRARENKIMLIKSLCAIFIPFIIVAIPLMYYNAIRFGSTFDFGAEYNLTSVNVYETTFSVLELRSGLWYYLLQLPQLTKVFPFIVQSYPKNIAVDGLKMEPSSGGLIASNLILLAAFILISYRSREKEQRTELKCCQWMMVGLAFLFVMISTAMGGLIERYQLDFAFLFGMAVVIVGWEIYQGTVGKTSGRVFESAIKILMVLMIAYQVPRFMMNGVWGLYDANPEVYAAIENAIVFWK